MLELSASTMMLAGKVLLAVLTMGAVMAGALLPRAAAVSDGNVVCVSVVVGGVEGTSPDVFVGAGDVSVGAADGCRPGDAGVAAARVEGALPAADVSAGAADVSVGAADSCRPIEVAAALVEGASPAANVPAGAAGVAVEAPGLWPLEVAPTRAAVELPSAVAEVGLLGNVLGP